MMKQVDKYKVDTKVITSRRIAWLLRMEGYRIIEVRPDRHRPERDVYIFKVAPGFQEKLDQIIEDTRRQKIQKE